MKSFLLTHHFLFYFSDFLLYVSPVYAALYLPDVLAVHFMHYYVYVRTLHYFQTNDELINVEDFFKYYQEHLSHHYGKKSELLTIHLHSHLKEQVLRHGSLLFTSCFPRESYLGHCLKWCHGNKYILEQFITWYLINKSLSRRNSYDLNRIFLFERLDNRFMNDTFIQQFHERLFICLEKKKIKPDSIEYFARYYRGLAVFHSLAYTKSGHATSYRVSILNETCPMRRQSCFGEVLFYLNVQKVNYAFVKMYYCVNCCLSNALSTVNVPNNLKQKLNLFYGFYQNRNYCYKVVPVCRISNKVIIMPWKDDASTYTDVLFDFEHD